MASQWYLEFTFPNALNSSLSDAIKSRETASSWSYDPNVTKVMIGSNFQLAQSVNMGCIFARQVTLPEERIEVGHTGLDYGGFMAPATASKRHGYQKLGITFLETNASFVDLILRPWSILVGYNGLVARDPKSSKYIKGNVNLVMLAKATKLPDNYISKAGFNLLNNSMAIRKVYQFTNVAPIYVPSEEYSYQEEGMRFSNVDFCYDSYSILDGNTSTMITSP
jgi:hypothetical protein